MKWSKQGIRGVSSARLSTRPAPAVAVPELPALEDVQRAVRGRDVDGLLRYRDAVAAYWAVMVERGASMDEAARDQLHAVKDVLRAGLAELTTDQAVALSNRQTAPGRPLAQRVAEARAALDSQLKPDPITGARAAEVRLTLNRTKEGR